MSLAVQAFEYDPDFILSRGMLACRIVSPCVG